MRRELLTGLAIAAAAAAGAACKRDADSPKQQPPPQAQGAAPAVPPPLAAGEFYRVDAGPRTPCTAGAPCEARLVLTALGGYKVNRDYPFKLVGDPVPGVTLEGPGTFAFDDAKTGTLTIRFRAAPGAPTRLTGTFKLSVCTEENCLIEEPKIALELPAS